ncbi:MAG: hypothetical protein ABIC57_00805 [bacterium]
MYVKVFKGSLMNLSATIILVILGVTVVVLVINYWDDIIVAIPGVVSHDEYNELTDQKNELIEENSNLLSQNSELETQLAALDSEDFVKKNELYNSIILNLQDVIENLEAMVGYGLEFAEMQLPVYVSRYAELSEELDQLRLDASKLSFDITQSRKDMNDLNWKRDNFDTCLNKVNWDGEDSDIQKEILDCVVIIDEVSEYVASLEVEYDIELLDMKNYFVILKEQWTESSNYYSALADGNYSKANDYDEVFATKRREIEEMDLDLVFGVFGSLVITPKVDEFAEVSQQISSKQNEVDTWYEENIER